MEVSADSLPKTPFFSAKKPGKRRLPSVWLCCGSSRIFSAVLASGLTGKLLYLHLIDPGSVFSGLGIFLAPFSRNWGAYLVPNFKRP